MDNKQTDLLSLYPEELTELIISLGEPKYRAGQIFPALHKGLAPSRMTNISKATAEKIEAAMPSHMPEIEQKLVSQVDGTVKYLFRLHDGECIESVVMLANEGNIENIDLRIKDMTEKNIGLAENLTASNFGKLSDLATKGDIALGLINLVFETAGMMSIFAARTNGIRDIVLTGHMTRIPQGTKIFPALSELFDVNFIIPENSEYGTVIGTALLDGKR